MMPIGGARLARELIHVLFLQLNPSADPVTLVALLGCWLNRANPDAGLYCQVKLKGVDTRGYKIYMVRETDSLS